MIAAAAMALSMQAQSAKGVVDVHSHIITPGYLATLKHHDALLDEGFPLPAWSLDAHLTMMDKNGIGISILTMPAPQPWWGDAAESIATIREVNRACFEAERQHPDRFRFAAALPLPDVEAAIEEAVYAIDSLGAVGVKLATNARGQYLGDEELEPLMRVLDERRATVIIHPHKPVPANDSMMAAVPLAVYEYPAETTRAVINMIASGVTSRYPNIRWVVPHCGSFLPLALARMKGVLPIAVKAGMMKPVDWTTATANIYYDLAGNLTPEVLASMLTITTPSHLLYGSDYPYVSEQGVTLSKAKVMEALKGNAATESMVDDILRGNAAKLFNIQ